MHLIGRMKCTRRNPPHLASTHDSAERDVRCTAQAEYAKSPMLPKFQTVLETISLQDALTSMLVQKHFLSCLEFRTIDRTVL